ADRETGVDAQDARHRREDLLVDALEIASIHNIDAQEIIRASGHQKALADFGMLAYGRLETIEIFLGLALQRDVDDNSDGCFRAAGVDDCRVTADDAGVVEARHAAEAGRRRETDGFGELGVGHAPVETEQSQDFPVDAVRAVHERNSLSSNYLRLFDTRHNFRPSYREKFDR